ncbi:protein of unknown function [Methanoculleus bourgensis]|uniref:Uncharacterized protein n=1 Tax=Methanoculleus bourgensis TaxID=83986 RepID=A0A0X8XZC1_9EURY|nr:protein of unknown function [Methanoculleus bourgensis]
MEPCLFRHGKWINRLKMQVRYGICASMEPCLFRHGKDNPTPAFCVQIANASMEPCLFRHGKTEQPTGWPTEPPSFNGAMSFQTW